MGRFGPVGTVAQATMPARSPTREARAACVTAAMYAGKRASRAVTAPLLQVSSTPKETPRFAATRRPERPREKTATEAIVRAAVLLSLAALFMKSTMRARDVQRNINRHGDRKKDLDGFSRHDR